MATIVKNIITDNCNCKNPDVMIEGDCQPTIVDVLADDALNNYEKLINKPSINGNVLVGDKTGEELGLIDAEEGKGLSTNDFTDDYKNKLDHIEPEAQRNVQSDWNQDNEIKDDYIRNKPTKVSAFENDADYDTQTDVRAKINAHNISDDAHRDIRQEIVNETNRAIYNENEIRALLNGEIEVRQVEDARLLEKINVERDTRILGDTLLQDNIDNEAVLRRDADTRLQTNIDNEASLRRQGDSLLQTQINTETANRIAADDVLQTQINTIDSKILNEANVRAEADSRLQTNIDNERIRAEDAESKLNDKIDQEITDRIASDRGFNNRLDVETAARISGDEALGQKIEAETTARTTADTELGTRITNEVTRATAAESGLDTRITTVSNNLESEITARKDADTALQEQIDAITSKSDVVDIVGTKAALNSYDTSELTDKDVIKVLKDESQSNATTYYRWNVSEEKFTFIGAEGPYYTVTEADNTFVPKTLTVNNKALNQNITLTYSDVNALSSTTTINDLTTTTQQNALNSGITSAGVTQITTNKNAIGTLSSLTTTNTNNLVNAVNELNTNKQENITGAASTITTNDLTVNRALISNENGKVAASSVTNTELGYISGVTSSIQTQLNAKANDADISKVGKSNNYNDLDNKPTIGNATITFKANGATITGQSFTTNATSNVEIDLGNTGLVDDVKVNNASIVTNKIANIPLANVNEYGVVRVNTNKGITASSGQLETIAASNAEITAKTNQYKVLTPSNLDVAIVQGLSNNANTMTDDQQSDTRDFIGATQVVLNDWS